MNKNYFSQFMPVSFDLIKSDDKNDDGRIYIKGIISTESVDAQGEILKQDGLDFSYFLKRGYINSEHKQGAENMLGAPTKVSKCMYKGKPAHFMEGYLFSDMSKVQDIVSVCKAMQKANADRGLGFSVEGKVEERDKKNPSVITKAKILNVSLVASPANPDSVLELLKSMEAQMQQEIEKAIPMSAAIMDSVMNPAIMDAAQTSEEAENEPQHEMDFSDVSEYEEDHDGKWALKELLMTKEHIEDLLEMIKVEDDLPEWLQSHLTIGCDYIHQVYHYLETKSQLATMQNMSGQMKEIQDKIQMAWSSIQESMNAKKPMSASLMESAKKSYEDISKPSLDVKVSNSDVTIHAPIYENLENEDDLKFSDEEALQILTTIMRRYPGLSKDEYMKMFYRVVAEVAERITEGKGLPAEMK